MLRAGDRRLNVMLLTLAALDHAIGISLEPAAAAP